MNWSGVTLGAREFFCFFAIFRFSFCWVIFYEPGMIPVPAMPFLKNVLRKSLYEIEMLLQKLDDFRSGDIG